MAFRAFRIEEIAFWTKAHFGTKCISQFQTCDTLSDVALPVFLAHRPHPMQRILLFFKGIFMGLADVVPGVSGGTIAFVLGIYPAFIRALSSINFRWVPRLFLYIVSGFKPKYLEKLKEDFFSVHWQFLFTLLSGMGVAILLGATFIPGLMERYPSQMRAFFLGLVLASIAVPLSAMRRHTRTTTLLIFTTAAWVFVLLGLQASPPVRWSQVSSLPAQSIQDFSRRHPHTNLPISVYCPNDTSHDNAALRRAHALARPDDARMLSHLCSTLEDLRADPASYAIMWREAGLTERRTDPYARVEIPANTSVWIATPALWHIFLAGAVAICAMVLPGISGSFILLILGLYTFIFSSIRGSILWATLRQDNALPALYVIVFGAGVLLGVMTFSRAVTYLFERHREATLAVLIGVMAGSLRVLWPFQIGTWGHGVVRNVLPAPDDPLLLCAALSVAGFLFVIGLSHASTVLELRAAGTGNEKPES